MPRRSTHVPALPDSRAAEEAWKAHELRVQGWSLRRIGQALNMGKDTVAARLDWANKQLLLPAVVEYRKVQNERLENLLAITLEDIREPMMYEGVHCVSMDGQPLYRLNLDKVKTARAIINDLSELHGTKAPVQMEHRMLEITEEDMALVEQINAATRERMEASGWTVEEDRA